MHFNDLDVLKLFAGLDKPLIRINLGDECSFNCIDPEAASFIYTYNYCILVILIVNVQNCIPVV